MRRLLVICHLSLVVCLAAFAQSQVNYYLRVGTTGEVKVLQDFPETYAGEKVNVSIQHSAFSILSSPTSPWSPKSPSPSPLEPSREVRKERKTK